MWTCVKRFLSESERLKAGAAGRDFAVDSESEGYGFESTELERSIFASGDQIRGRLSKRPGDLSVEVAEGILRALVNCRAGITSRRCRLLAYAGDYGDTLTPTAEIARGIVEDLRRALEKLGPKGGRILAGLPAGLLSEKIPFFVYLGGGDEAMSQEKISDLLRR